jgi:hypothetical protein
LALTLFSYLKNNNKWQRIALFVLPLFSLIATLRIMDSTKAWFPKSQIRIYQSNHYIEVGKYFEYKTALNTIKDNQKVCAQNALQALLSYRNDAYLFPYHIEKAEVLALDTSLSTYPLNEKDYMARFHFINKDTLNWKRINNHQTLFIFERKLK